MASKKDYELIAKVIGETEATLRWHALNVRREAPIVGAFQVLTNALCLAFRQQNDQFDSWRFKESVRRARMDTTEALGVTKR